jgi:hypothetical protein
MKDPMTVVKKLEAGGFYALAEYRGGKPDTVRYRDGKTGAAAQFSQIVHNLESGPMAFVLQERLPDGANLEAIAMPFPKGTQVLVRIESIERIQGFLRAQGAMYAC